MTDEVQAEGNYSFEQHQYNVVALGDGEKPDIAICSVCGWRGPATECITDEEGDWESGYYKVDLCPKCEDGGSIDDYDFSEYPGEYPGDFETVTMMSEGRDNAL